MIELTSLEKHLFERARRLDVNPFSSHFFKLPASGTRYTPEDHVTQYEMIYDLWQQAGKPGDTMALQANGQDLKYLLEWGAYGSEPVFLFPHGYLFLPWAIDMITSRKPIAVVEGGTGSAKCLPAGSLVQMADGSRKPVEAVCRGETVLGLDEHYKIRPQHVTDLFRDKDSPLLKIRLRLGQALTCTPDHPLRTVNGWKPAKELKLGDFVAVPRKLPFGNDDSFSAEEATLLALLLGDGCLRRRGSPYFTNTDPRLRNLFRSSVNALFPSCQVKPCHSHNRAFTLTARKADSDRRNPLADWCRKLGIDWHGSHDKFIPEILFRQKDPIVAQFLACLYGCDGYASIESGRPIVSYTSCSMRLVQDVQSLLLRFGIVGHINKRISHEYDDYVYYTLEFSQDSFVNTFLQFIGIEGKDTSAVWHSVRNPNPRASGSMDIITKIDVRPYVKTKAKERGTPLCRRLTSGIRPNENFRMRKNPTRWKLLDYAAWLEDAWLKDLATSDVFWTSIEEITELETAPTYNLEVEPDSNFIVDGVITHNTSTLGIYSIIQCALHPGCDILNVAPSADQAMDMLIEISKWVEHSEFAKFVTLTNNGDLYKQKPHPTLTINVFGIPSTFMTMTVGLDGNFVLGKDKDAVRIDEASMINKIGDAVPKLISRIRGVRQSGIPRGVYPYIAFITNPHDGNYSFDRLKIKAAQLNSDPKSKYFFARPSSRDNIYITNQQLEIQMELMDRQQRRRWLDGEDDVFATLGAIPRVLIDNCLSPYLNDLVAGLAESKSEFYEEREGMGCIHFELPADPHCEYLVVGDPGTANASSIDINNVPAIMVFDVTSFPARQANLVAMRLIDGGGKYGPWISEMTRLITKYRAIAAFDATGMGTAFSEWHELSQLPLFKVSLSGNNKATARTMFMLFCGKGLYAWPDIDVIWHQAHAYRESGVGVANIPDDIMACLFVATFYLRDRYWTALRKILKAEREDDDGEMGPTNKRPRRDRYARRGGGRGVRRRIKTARPTFDSDFDE